MHEFQCRFGINDAIKGYIESEQAQEHHLYLGIVGHVKYTRDGCTPCNDATPRKRVEINSSSQ